MAQDEEIGTRWDFEEKRRFLSLKKRKARSAKGSRSRAGKSKQISGNIAKGMADRKRREETLSHRAEELQALQATILDITRRKDLRNLLNAIVERAAYLLRAPSGGLYICDPNRREVRCVVSYNTPIDFTGTVLKYGEGVAGHVAETGQPLVVDDYRSWPGRAKVFEKDQPFTALLSTPMIWQGEVTGVIDVLDSAEARTFTRSDLELLGLFANHAAIALENQRSLEALKRSEKEVRKQREEQQVILDSVPALIFYKDRNNRFIRVNKALADSSGKPREHIEGKSASELYPQADYWTDDKEVMASGSAKTHIIEPLETPKGRRWLDTAKIPYRDANGNIIGIIGFSIDITERELAEQKLRLQGQITENMVEGVVLIRAADGVIVYMNPRFEAMFDYGPGELIGKNIAIVNAPIDGKSPEDVAKEIIANIEKTGAWSGEVRNIKKDGTPFWCRANVSSLKDSEYGAIWVATQEDITDRKQAEEALRRRADELAALQATVLDITSIPSDLQKLLEAIVERAVRLLGALSGGFYLCDPEGREAKCVVSYNTKRDVRGVVLKYGDGAAGRVAETAKPLIINDYSKWEGRAGVYEKDKPFGAVLSAPTIWQGEVTGVIDVMDESTVRRFTQEDLELLMLFANHAAIAVERTRVEEELKRHSRDLEKLVDQRTRRLRESEQELRSTKERLEYVIASNPAVIYSGKLLPDYSDWQLTYLSERVASMLGFEPQEFVGHPKFWESHVHPDDLRSVLSKIPRFWKQGKRTFEYRFLHKEGTYRWIREESRVVHDETGKPVEVIGYWIDVTERKQMEERLLKAERLAGIGETAAMVGHDLRNPLQGIVAAAYALRKQLGPSVGESAREMINVIEKSVEYADGIVRDLLDYSGEMQLELHEATPRAIAKDVLARIPVPEGITISDLTTDETWLKVDSARLRRVFINLVENAIEAMPNGGEIAITSKEANGTLELKFTDTGPGISEKALETLWKPLITTKPKGLGLGLAICKRIVEAHGGSISVESTLGQGTTFTLMLPTKLKEAIAK